MSIFPVVEEVETPHYPYDYRNDFIQDNYSQTTEFRIQAQEAAMSCLTLGGLEGVSRPPQKSPSQAKAIFAPLIFIAWQYIL
jgi:hypothetical protein